MVQEIRNKTSLFHLKHSLVLPIPSPLCTHMVQDFRKVYSDIKARLETATKNNLNTVYDISIHSPYHLSLVILTFLLALFGWLIPCDMVYFQKKKLVVTTMTPGPPIQESRPCSCFREVAREGFEEVSASAKDT